MIKNVIKVNAYNVVRRAVEEGAAIGYRRAHKHTATPAEAHVVDAVETAIMDELSDVILWEETESDT